MVEKAIHNSSGYDVVWQFGSWAFFGLWICQLYHPLNLPNWVKWPPGASQDSHSTSFPRFAKLWLAFVGLLDFPHSCGPFSRPGCALFISSLLLVILVASVISLTSAGVSDPYISATTLCYLLGVLAAAWRLRWSGVQDLLMRDNGGLEETRKGGKNMGRLER